MFIKEFACDETSREWRFIDKDTGILKFFVRYLIGFHCYYVIWGNPDNKYIEEFDAPAEADKRFIELADFITARLIRWNALAEC